MDLNKGPGWRRLNDSPFACSFCGGRFCRTSDVGQDHRDAWPHAKPCRNKAGNNGRRRRLAHPCAAAPTGTDDRVWLTLQDGAHDLARTQREGVTFDRPLDIHATDGQDIRPHLMDA